MIELGLLREAMRRRALGEGLADALDEGPESAHQHRDRRDENRRVRAGVERLEVEGEVHQGASAAIRSASAWPTASPSSS